MLESLYAFRTRGIKFGLRNIRLVLQRLGQPQKRYLSVHVAGTNGKGSTAAILHHIVTAAGYRSGLYTSPHLLDMRERYIVDRTPASPEELNEVYRAVAGACRQGEDPPLTFFEWATAMAFLLFSWRGVEVAVFEAGMGGRLDATRMAEGPLLLLNRIGLDHTEFLGKTREIIAGEKAGLIGSRSMVVAAPQPGGVMEVFTRTAARRSARLVSMESSSLSRVYGTDLDGVAFDLSTAGRRLPRLYLPLPGRHQAGNASLAVLGGAVLEMNGLSIGDEALYNGLSETYWPGRIQSFGERPTIILDAAHNVDSMEVLAAFMTEVFPDGDFPVVLAVLEDKDVGGILRSMKIMGARLFVAPCSTDRSASPGDLATLAAEAGVRVSGTYPSVASALDAAISSASGEEPILVTGSLFTVGEAAAFLKENDRHPASRDGWLSSLG
jgi:dihydrofolate synthase/folylpolyglutamate synthase